MPKRVATPPPAEDEPRYLTVVHPYTLAGTCNMELARDRQDFALWVACCIDKDAFFAMFHKPSSRGMVIIEVSRSYPHFERILGEHRWSEFLRRPTKGDDGRVTRVFYCTYSTGRIVQKNGWKRIDVDEAWFKSWSPNNKQIKFPYPAPHFCEVPVEDQTNQSLCRPLPGLVTPPPATEIAAPQPVVGSTAWIQKKEGGPSPVTTQNKPKTLNAWSKGTPKAQGSVRPNPSANVNANKTATIPQGPPTSTRMPAVGGGTITVKSSNVWQHTGAKPTPAPVATNWEESPPASRQGTPMSAPAVFPEAANQAPAAPPGLQSRGSGTTSYPPGLAVPGRDAASAGSPDHATMSATSWGSHGASTSSPDTDSGPATESDNPFAAHINFSESMEEEFHGMRIRAMDDGDDGDLLNLDAIAPGTWDGPAPDATWETTNAPGWNDEPLEAEDIWRQNQVTKKPVQCKAHGVLCKKGICEEYHKQHRLALAEERRAAAAANKGKKGRSKARGGQRNDHKENETGDGGATQNNNPFRGPGAPVKTNWRGAPRMIVDADAVEKREAAKVTSDDGWGDSDWEGEPKAAAVASVAPPAVQSDAGWDVPEDAFDPWAVTTETQQPVTKGTKGTKGNRSGGKPPQGKKPGQANVSTSWADQVEAEFAGGGKEDGFSTVSSKRSSKRGTSTTSWGTSSAKTSTSGWGSAANADMPW